MPITINGAGTVTGISVGGFPDGCVATADVADGAITQVKRSEQLTLATAQASTSGTAIDFTGIPSWVKRVTVMLNGVSTNGTNNILVQLGAGSVTSTGYFSYSCRLGGASVAGGANFTTGFGIAGNSASFICSGSAAISLLGSNAWTANGFFAESSGGNGLTFGGAVALSGTLDRIRITTVNGTDTFDAGSINILYE